MKRFAQNKKPVPDSEPSYEKEIADQKTKQFEEFKKSQQVALEFCKDLQNIGTNLKEEATKLPVQFLPVKIAMSAIGDKLDTIGKDAETIITVKLGTEVAFESGKIVSTFFQNQKPNKSPGLKRFVPLIGDLANLDFVRNLKWDQDFKSKFDTIAEPYKCNGAQDHYTKKPIWNGVVPNFNDHPELADQHSKKAEAVSQLIATFGTLVQLLETLAAWIATAMGNIPLVIAIRTIGGLIGILIQALSIAFSPNTYDIQEYSREDFEGGGIDPKSPFAFMNEIPGLSKYIKQYESKPIAEETAKASEKRIQNFILEEIYKKGDKLPKGDVAKYDFVLIQDTLGNVEALANGMTWPKWRITITGIYEDGHVEYKDQYNNKYSIRKNALPGFGRTPSFSFGDTTEKGYSTGEEFLKIMKEAADLSTSNVKGNVDLLLSKNKTDIISLLYQLKSKYPWIGTKNPNWINLKNDIITHTPKANKANQIPNIVKRETSVKDYKEKYFKTTQFVDIPLVGVKEVPYILPPNLGAPLQKVYAVMDAIKAGTLSQMNWDKWSDIGKQAIIEEAIDRLEKAGYGIPGVYRGTAWAPPISKDILNQLSPKYRPGYRFKPPTNNR